MKKLGFKEIPQELCVVQKDGIIGFFYVDNIVFAFKKNQDDEVKKIVESLSQALMMSVHFLPTKEFEEFGLENEICFWDQKVEDKVLWLPSFFFPMDD